MNNFTRSSRAYWGSIMNLKCDPKGLHRKGIKAVMLFMLFALSSGATFAQDFINGCMHDAPNSATAETYLVDNTDFSHCVGLLIHYVDSDIDNYPTEVRGELFPEGVYNERSGFSKESNHCDWTYYHVFTVKCDPTSEDVGAGGDATFENHTVVYTGGDTEQPKLIKGKVFPPGDTKMNLCYADKPGPHSTDYIAGLYSDNCEHIKVGGDFVKLRTKTKEDDCKWIVIYTYTIWDGCTEPIIKSITYTGGDTEAPEFDADEIAKIVPKITVDCDDPILDIDNAPTLSWTDNCTDPGKNKVSADDDVSKLGIGCAGGIVYRTWTVKDNCGWETSFQQEITVNPAPQAYYTVSDNNSAEASFLGLDYNDENGHIELECEEKDNFTANDLPYSNGRESDRCGIYGESKGAFTIPADDCDSFVIAYTFTDECDRKTARDITVYVIDRKNPVILTAAMDKTVECDGDGNTEAYNTWVADNAGAAAQDNCDDDLVWHNNADSVAFSDDCGETGSKTVIFTVTDDCDNASKTYATFTIVDRIDPDISKPAMDFGAVCDGAGNTKQYEDWIANLGGAYAEDICSGVTWTHDGPVLKKDETLADGYLFGGCSDFTGYIDVTFTAWDDCENSSQTTARFSIEDSVAPDLTPASDETVECDGTMFDNPDDIIAAEDANGPGWPANSNIGKFHDWLWDNGGATASDICSEVKWSTYKVITGDACEKVITVTFTAADECGNESETTASFTIVDTLSPMIGKEAQDLVVECDGRSQPDVNGGSSYINWRNNHGGAEAMDMCDDDLDWTYEEQGKFSDECGLTGAITVVFTVTDDCGLSSSTSAEYRVEDTTRPTFTRPENTTIYKDFECKFDSDPKNTGDVYDEWDNCVEYDIEATYKDEILKGNCPGDTVIKRTWSLVDECGNEAYDQVQTIYVEDDSAPVLHAELLPLDMSDLDLCEAPVGPSTDDVKAAFTDNCTDVIVEKTTEHVQTGECGWLTNYVFSIRDECDNYADVIKITYWGSDQSDPNLRDGEVLPAKVSGINDCIDDSIDENSGLSVDDVKKMFEDNCDEYLRVEKSDAITSYDYCDSRGWKFYYRFTITDNCENSFIFDQEFNGRDQLAPVLTDPTPIDESKINACLEDAPDCVDLQTIADKYDECGNVLGQDIFVSVERFEFGGGEDCEWTVVCVYTVTDACGNVGPEFKVTYSGKDEVAPIIVCPDPVDMSYEDYAEFVEQNGPNADPFTEEVVSIDDCANTVTKADDTDHVHTVGTPVSGNDRWVLKVKKGDSGWPLYIPWHVYYDLGTPIGTVGGKDYYEGIAKFGNGNQYGNNIYRLWFDLPYGDWHLEEKSSPGDPSWSVIGYTYNLDGNSAPCDNWNQLPSRSRGIYCIGTDSPTTVHTFTRTYTVTDDCGNSSSCDVEYSFTTLDSGSSDLNELSDDILNGDYSDDDEDVATDGHEEATGTEGGVNETLDFRAYPVPFNGEVTLAYNFDFDTNVTVEVYDTKGLLVLTKDAGMYSKGTEATIDVTINGADQLYYVRVITSEGTITKKIVSGSN